jgi:molybdopterin synthase catalytic subunit/molybdopterin converting factor small subunit
MQVRVLCFGILKDWCGATETPIELPEGATVSDLLNHLTDALQAPSKLTPALSKAPAPRGLFSGIAVSVNAEYANASHVLHEGDEVGLLPPVSGGCPTEIGERHGSILLTRAPIAAEAIVAAAKRGEDGAVVVFDGIVRNNTRGRQTLHLDYEAYEEMAAKQMEALASEARTKFAVRHITMIHRLGRLQVGDTSVLIVVASAHRGAAFDACRWLIDTLKKQVPIWKKETFVDGAVWAAGEAFPAELAVEPEAVHGR